MVKRHLNNDNQVMWAAALLLLAFFLANNALRFQSIDEVANFIAARSLLGHGSVDGDILAWRAADLGVGTVVVPGVDGHYYVVKDIGPSLAGLPFVWLAHQIDVSPARSILLVSSFATVLTAAILFKTIRLWGYSQRTALLGMLAFGLATHAWPYAETLHTQSLTALGLSFAVYHVFVAQKTKRWQVAFWGGVGAGIAGLNHFSTWSTAPVYVFYLLLSGYPDWKKHLKQNMWLSIALCLGAAPFLVGQGWYNMMRFGSIFQTSWQQSGAASYLSPRFIIPGIFSQIVSAPRGVIWYSPVTMLVPVGLWIAHRKKQWQQVLLPLAQFAVILLVTSAYATGTGGLAWGPRLLTSALPALTLLIVPVLGKLSNEEDYPKTNLLIGALLLFSFATQLMASLLDNLNGESQIWQDLRTLIYDLTAWENYAFFFNVRLLPYVRLVQSAQEGRWDTLWTSTGQGVDFALLALNILLIGLAATWLVMSLKKRVITGGIVTQAGLSIAVIIWILMRYPAMPGAFSTEQTYYPDVDPLATTLTAYTQPGDGVIALLPYSYIGWIDFYDSITQDYGLPLEKPLNAVTQEYLQMITLEHERLWLVTEIPTDDPANGLEPWLAHNGFTGDTIWVDNYRIVNYTLMTEPPIWQNVSAVFGENEIELTDYAVQKGRGPWLNVKLHWKALRQPDDYYIVTVQLQAHDGFLITQHDMAPGGGFSPTPGWEALFTIEDNHSISLPPALPAGTYQLVVALYRPTDGQRLPVVSGLGDSAYLGSIEISADN